MPVFVMGHRGHREQHGAGQDRRKPLPNTYESSQILVAALLSGGLDSKSYRDLIADVEELASAGFGLDMIYWMLELVEEFMRASAPDADARQLFLHRALSKMAPLYSRLSGLQRAAIARLATELGWPLGSLGIEAVTIRS